MNFRKSILMAGLLTILAGNAGAQTNAVRPLSLEEAIRLALEHNLEVQVERFGPQLAQFDISGVYGAYDPVFSASAIKSFRSSPGGFDSLTGLQRTANETDVESYDLGLSGALPTGLNYDFAGTLDRSSGNTISGFEYRPDASVNLSQPLLRNFWIDQTRQQIWVNRKLLQISELALEGRIMDVVNRVEQAYYDLIFAIENVRVQEKALELAERLLAENKRRVEVGALAPLDEKQAEAQAAGSRADLLSARRTLDLQQNVLKRLITDNYQAWHAVDIQPAERLIAIPERFNVIESWQKGMAQRRDLLQAKLDIERRDIVLRYQKNQLFPQLDLIGSYGRSGLDRHFESSFERIRDGDNPRHSYGVLFSIPLSNRGPRTRYNISKAEKEQALLLLKELEQNIMVQIDDAVKLAQTSFERVDATRQARLYAEAALDAEQKKLENGKSTSFIVLQLQRDLTTARSAEIRALADYNKALAQLAFNEGTVFDRNRLSVNVR